MLWFVSLVLFKWIDRWKIFGRIQITRWSWLHLNELRIDSILIGIKLKIVALEKFFRGLIGIFQVKCKYIISFIDQSSVNMLYKLWNHAGPIQIWLAFFRATSSKGVRTETAHW
jgi:hypothetical protein